MKLLYISSPSFADCDFPLIKQLKNKGLDVTYLILLTPYELRSTLVDIKSIYPHTGIFSASVYPEFKKFSCYMPLDKVFICNRHGLSKKTISYWKNLFLLYNFIKNGKFDIIHSDLLFSGDKKFLYKFGSFITTVHDPFPHSGENWNYNNNSYLQAIKNSAGIVLLNSKQKIEFCHKYSVEENKVLVNRLGPYDVINYIPSNKVSDPIENNVLFFGRIAPYKGVEYLCEAMKMVHKVIPSATLTIAGGGKLYFDFAPYHALGYIELRNYYVGLEELSHLIDRASICVCPYTDATQSGVIMTSVAKNKPVVATDVGGLGEMVEENNCGIVVAPKNPEALADGIIKLLEDKKHIYHNIKLNNKTLNRGGWSEIADCYIEFYNRIISS